MQFKGMFTLLILAIEPHVFANAEICLGNCTNASGFKECTFTVVVDIFASHWGYFTFRECGPMTNPTLGIEKGVTYYFDQTDISNYYHPLGFAYLPDGAHANGPELEPGICSAFTECTCQDNLTCPTPMYMLNGEYIGTYRGNKTKQESVNDVNFGLSYYRANFSYSIVDWVKLGTFGVKLKLNEDDEISSDIFYFCHSFEFMSGRIKILSNNKRVQAEDFPSLPYKYYKQSEYDKSCGTVGIDPFQLPQDMCPERFVCGAQNKNVKLKQFASCIESMDCAMVVGMTNGVRTEDETALYIHQMIPHQQNAVNMAKALMKTGKVKCDDIGIEDDPQCIIEKNLRNVIVTQNVLIQEMQNALKQLNYPLEDRCVISYTADNSAYDFHSKLGFFFMALASLMIF